MRLALQQARRAQALGEVPIGCVIVKEGEVIARGYNRRNTDHNTLSHAELNAIRKASRKLQDWRLEGCTIYITLEPCQMCSGAIVQSRIDRCVVGAMNPKAGCAGSVMNLLQVKGFNHQVDLTTGILEEACSQMLSEFFRRLRQEKQGKTAENLPEEKQGKAAAAAGTHRQIAFIETGNRVESARGKHRGFSNGRSKL
jgi:tRNA(adenine34) deaminase